MINKNKPEVKRLTAHGLKHGSYRLNQLSCVKKSLHFSKIYQIHQRKYRYLIAFFCGILLGLVNLFLVKNVGNYSYGVSSFCQGISRLIYFSLVYNKVDLSPNASWLIYTVLFWCLIIVINIPLLIFSWKKIGHTFTIMTTIYLVTSSLFGLMIDQIPAVKNIFLFGNPILVGDNNWVSNLQNNNVNILPFMLPDGVTYGAHSENYAKPLLSLLYGVLHGILSAMIYAVLYIVDGCTGGADIVSIYFAKCKNANISLVLMITNLSLMLLSSTMGNFIPAILTDTTCQHFYFFLSANFVSTCLSLVVFKFVFNAFFPKSRMLKVDIYSKKAEKINDHLFACHYQHATSLIENVVGGYSKEKTNQLSTICSSIELPSLIQHIKHADKNCNIVVSVVLSFEGKLNVRQHGSLQ